MNPRRKGYFKNKYTSEWLIVLSFLLAVLFMMMIN